MGSSEVLATPTGRPDQEGAQDGAVGLVTAEHEDEQSTRERCCRAGCATDRQPSVGAFRKEACGPEGLVVAEACGVGWQGEGAQGCWCRHREQTVRRTEEDVQGT